MISYDSPLRDNSELSFRESIYFLVYSNKTIVIAVDVSLVPDVRQIVPLYRNAA